MIITTGGIKGGTGKSTIATNLAVMLSKQNSDVLLIDTDAPQFTASDFTQYRHETLDGEVGYTAVKLTGQSIMTEGKKLASKYDHVVIDSGARDSVGQRAAMVITDIYLVPFKPRSFDMWTFDNVLNLIGEAQVVNVSMRAFGFINCADPVGRDNDEAAEILKDDERITFINTHVGNRKAFSNASAAGLAVVEAKPQDKKAIAEITRLYDFCLRHIVPA